MNGSVAHKTFILYFYPSLLRSDRAGSCLFRAQYFLFQHSILLILLSIATGASWVTTMHQDHINALREHGNEVDPHYYKPLPLPLKDAMIYVRKYGPYAAEKRNNKVKRHSKKSIRVKECRQRDRPPSK